MTLTFANPTALAHAEIEEGKTFAPRFDDKGLITAITMEAGTNDLLMLAHMNAEALALTLETGFAHYWSRSRGKIWKKGESSGELQRIVELRVDCDQDAIVLMVEQTGRGAACHTGRKSCFYRQIVSTDGAVTLHDLGLPKLFDPSKIY